MYKTYFGFREKPFSKTPDPRFLFLSSGHDEALARLEFVVEEREIAVLTGEIDTESELDVPTFIRRHSHTHG